jgi:hypothetical protein
MKLNAISKLMLTAFATVALAIPAMAGEVKMSGNVEINIDNIQKVTDPEANEDNTEESVYSTGGRAELVAEGSTKAGDLVASGKGCMELKVDGTVGICDVWVKVGTSNFDVQVGRFEKIGVYGKGLDIMAEGAPTGPGIYEANYARGRGPGDLALHFTGENFTLELGATYGNESFDFGDNVVIKAEESQGLLDEDLTIENEGITSDYIGFRPAADIKFGPIGVVAAFETLNIRPTNNDLDQTTTKSGGGLKITYSVDMFDAGLNFTSGKITGEVINVDAEKSIEKAEVITDTVDKADETNQTIGGYVTFKFDGKEAGLGYHVTNQEIDADGDENDQENVGSLFLIGYSHPLPVEGAAIKLGFSSANGKVEQDGKDVNTSSTNAARVRFWYEF